MNFQPPDPEDDPRDDDQRMQDAELEAHRVRFEQAYAKNSTLPIFLVTQHRIGNGYKHAQIQPCWQAYQWALADADADRAQRAASGVQGGAPMIAGCSVCYGSGIDVAGRPCPFAPHRIGAATPAMYGNKPPQQSAQPDVPETDCGNIAQPVAEVVQMNQSRYFSCLDTSETTTPQIGAKLYAAPQPEEVQRHAVSLSKDRQNRIYIAGPMTGYAEFNFPAFNVMADKLRAQGFHVENPAEHGIVDGAEWADYLHYDIGRLATCAYLMLLPGWSKSKGAALEVSIAKGLGMGVNFAEGAEAQPVEVQPLTVDAVWANDEIMTLNAVMMLPMDYFMRVVRAIEAAHGIKPTSSEGGA